MANTQKIVKFWRGTRAAYDQLVKDKQIDYWTRYSVKENASSTAYPHTGLWTEYFGYSQIHEHTGQLYPVDKLCTTLPSAEELTPGKRFLVGVDGTFNADGSVARQAEYYVVEIMADLAQSKIEPLGNLSVRVKDNSLFSYQIVNNKLYSYDKYFDGGTF